MRIYGAKNLFAFNSMPEELMVLCSEQLAVCHVELQDVKTAMKECEVAAVKHFCSLVNRVALDNGILELCDTSNITLLAHRPFGP